MPLPPTSANNCAHKCFKHSEDLLVSMMKSPMDSNTCGWNIFNAISCFALEYDPLDIPAKRKFATSHPEYLRAGVRFLTWAATESDHKAMVERFSRCNCDVAYPQDVFPTHKPCALLLTRPLSTKKRELLYFPPPAAFELVLPALMGQVVSMLRFALMKLSPGGYRNTTHAVDGVKKWPQDLDDLLPFGVEQTIKALEKWATETPTKVTCAIYELSAPLAFFSNAFQKELYKVIDGEFKYELVFGLPLHHLQNLMDAYDLIPNPDAAQAPPGPTPRHLQRVYQELCDTFVSIQMIPTMCPDFYSRCFRYYDDVIVILRNLRLVFARTNDKSMDPLKNVLDQFGPLTPEDITPEDIWFKVPDGAGVEELYLHLLESLKPVKPANSRKEDLDSAWEKISRVPLSGCMGPACPIIERAEGSIQRCARCSHVLFCGKKCQREAWNDPEHPHKEVCRKICKLRESVGLERWQKMFSRSYTTTVVDFKDQCRELSAENKVDVELVLDVAKTLGILLTKKCQRKQDNSTDI